MKLSTRLSNAYKVLTNKELSNSLGSVFRNLGTADRFIPIHQYQGITFKAIDKTATSLEVYSPIFLRKSGDPYTNHPLMPVFNRPNPQQTSASDFIYLWASLYEIYGESFWYKARGERTGRIKQLILLDPSRIELKIEAGEVIGYILHKADGTQVPFDFDEIHHDKRSNPFNEYRGLSILEKAAIYSNTEITTATFTLNYLRNSGSPSGIVTLPNMSPDAFKTFTAQWRENYEGPENAGKTGFIRGGEASFQAVGATLKDIDQKVTRSMAKEDVLMMLDVPKALLGMTDDNGFGRANVETFKYIFAESKLEPYMKRLDRIYIELARDFREEISAVTHLSPIPEDREFKLKTFQAGVNVWMTPNEVRAEYNLEPLPGGDEIKDRAPVVQVKSKKVELKKSVKTKSLTEEQEEFRSNLVDKNETYAIKVKTAITQFTEKQEKKVISNINASAKTYEEWLYSVKEESEALAVLISPIILDLMRDQAKDVANFITGELLTMTPEIEATVSAEMLKISGVFNQDTIVALQKTLAEGQAKGESLVSLKKRVESVYSDAKGYRAERIARTESLRSSNLTAEMVYKQNGFSRVQWFVNPGACEFCKTFAGRTKEIGSVYNSVGDVITGDQGGQLKIDYSDIQTPPLHPNCTCSQVPVK